MDCNSKARIVYTIHDDISIYNNNNLSHMRPTTGHGSP